MATNQQSTMPSTGQRKKLAFAAITVAIAALAVGLTVTVISPNQNNQASSNAGSSTSKSWIAIGDYATYSGQTNILSLDISFNAEMEIVGVNSTHIEVQTDFNMSTPFGSDENSTTTWVNRENMTFQPEGLSLNTTYNAQVQVPGLGTRTCTVYQYSSEGVSATYYVDTAIQWPIKICLTSPQIDGQTYSMDVTLVGTNIPGL